MKRCPLAACPFLPLARLTLNCVRFPILCSSCLFVSFFHLLLVVAAAAAAAAAACVGRTRTYLARRRFPFPFARAQAAVSAVVFHVTHMVLSVILKWALVQRFSEVDGVCCTTSWFGFRKQVSGWVGGWVGLSCVSQRRLSAVILLERLRTLGLLQVRQKNLRVGLDSVWFGLVWVWLGWAELGAEARVGGWVMGWVGVGWVHRRHLNVVIWWGWIRLGWASLGLLQVLQNNSIPNLSRPREPLAAPAPTPCWRLAECS